jgi:hypothetical protein
LSLASGDRYLAFLEAAARGDDEGFLLVVEGSLFDQRLVRRGKLLGLGDRGGSPFPPRNGHFAGLVEKCGPTSTQRRKP